MNRSFLGRTSILETTTALYVKRGEVKGNKVGKLNWSHIVKSFPCQTLLNLVVWGAHGRCLSQQLKSQENNQVCILLKVSYGSVESRLQRWRMGCGQKPENVKVNYTQVPSTSQLARGDGPCPLSAHCLISFLVRGLGC